LFLVHRQIAGIALITTAVVAVLLAKAIDSKIIILVVVAYLTLAVPVFQYWRTDPDVWVVVRDATVGLEAGFVWITPFAVWALVSRRKTS
jgi:hypothetical protein